MISLQQGIILIADPFLKDPSFSRSIILLCDHKEEGSFGFILNKLFPLTLNQIIENYEDLDLPVYMGGPVEENTLHFIHNYPQKIKGSYKIMDGVYWGGDIEAALDLLAENKNAQTHFKFFVGYAGWSKNQLADELSEKSWILSTGNTSLIYSTDSEVMWKNSVKNLGEPYKMMANFPMDPTLN